LIVLVTAYAGRKIRLVCDNGRFHHTKAVREWLKANRAIIKIDILAAALLPESESY